MAAREIGPEDRLVVMACPRSNADIIVMREVSATHDAEHLTKHNRH